MKKINIKFITANCISLLIILLTTVCIAQQKTDQTEKVSKIDSFFQQTLHKDLNTEAALAVAVIEGENVMFEKVYGKRNVLRDLPATTDTPFYIASVTKSFMALLAKLLEDEGRIKLDEPISTYLGNSFEFKNTNLDASKISIRDLLTHQSGIENDAITWRTAYTGEDADNNDLLLKLFEKSNYNDVPFKYTNNGYILTGIILEKVTGQSWQELLDQKIFNKLEVNKTSAKPYADFSYEEPALGHKMEEGKTVLGQAQKQNENSHAAGGIFSSLFDLEKWLFIQINEGKYNGKQVFPAPLLKDIHDPQIKVESGFYTYERNGYDLGWYHGTYEGEKLIHCFGSFPGGYRAHVSYMPEKKIGVIALTNLFPEGIFLPDIAANYVYDTLLKKDSLNDKYDGVMKNYKRILGLVKEESTITDIGVPSTLKKDNLGDYSNLEYGTLTLFMEKENPYMKMGKLGLVKSKLLPISEYSLRMLNPDFFSRNDLLDTSRISEGIVILQLGDDKVSYKRLKEQQ